jgi:hypothetical protein
MTSQLTTLVPTLNGSGNYQEWSTQMKAYLQSQSAWRVLTKECPNPTTTSKPVETGSGEEASITMMDSTNEAEIEKWEDANSKAIGCMRLRLHPSISYKHNKLEKAGELWDALKEEYGAPGKSAIYLEFKTVLDTPLPPNSDPCIVVDMFSERFGRMAEAKCPVPEYLQCMIILSKIPQNMGVLAQQLSLSTKGPEEMKLEDLRKMLALSWDHKSGGRNQNNQAHRISAVKRGPETPGFSQQQEDNQQREDGSYQRGRGGKRYRGKRGGKKPQAQTAEEQPQAGPSNSASTAQSSPGTLEFGFMASSAQIPPHKSFYPSFGKPSPLPDDSRSPSPPRPLNVSNSLRIQRKHLALSRRGRLSISTTR